jgi:hypothetical protein
MAYVIDLGDHSAGGEWILPSPPTHTCTQRERDVYAGIKDASSVHELDSNSTQHTFLPKTSPSRYSSAQDQPAVTWHAAHRLKFAVWHIETESEFIHFIFHLWQMSRHCAPFIFLYIKLVTSKIIILCHSWTPEVWNAFSSADGIDTGSHTGQHSMQPTCKESIGQLAILGPGWNWNYMIKKVKDFKYQFFHMNIRYFLHHNNFIMSSTPPLFTNTHYIWEIKTCVSASSYEREQNMTAIISHDDSSKNIHYNILRRLNYGNAYYLLWKLLYNSRAWRYLLCMHIKHVFLCLQNISYMYKAQH